MKQQSVFSARLRPFLLTALAVLLICGLSALPVRADSGDYDEITNYVLTVDPQPDGSADLTYDIDWKVIGGSAEDYLYWVKIGLPNSNVSDFQNLSPETVIDVSYLEDGGSYARVTFKQHYYAPDVAASNGGKSTVHFSFKVRQSHLFTRNDDNTASFVFTPGWFDDLCVDAMQVRWKNYEGFIADNTSVDGDYLVWDFGPLAHGDRATVHVTVPVATADAFDPAAAQTAEDWGQGSSNSLFSDSSEEDDIAIAVAVVIFWIVLLIIIANLRSARWRGGLGTDDSDDGFIYYSNGSHVVHFLPGHPAPPGYHVVSAPHSGSVRPGGGSFRGGGAGRSSSGSSHSSCACACASSCACACACAGGGRAGCSVKNIYTVKIPAGADAKAEKELHHGA